jgi:hypothetical protein
MLYHFETAEELSKLKVDFIRTDLAVALTFAQIALQTDIHHGHNFKCPGDTK